MYIEDLAACSKFTKDKRFRAVGWIDPKHQFNKGDLDAEFIENLNQHEIFGFNPHFPTVILDCSVCLEVEAESVFTATTLFTIPSKEKDVIYLSPSIITHFVEEHGYRPPQEYIDAVKNCPPQFSNEFFQLLSKFDLAPNKLDYFFYKMKKLETDRSLSTVQFSLKSALLQIEYGRNTNETFFSVANAYYKLQDYENAKLSFCKLLDVFGEEIPLPSHLKYIECCIRTGNFRESLKNCNLAIDKCQSREQILSIAHECHTFKGVVFLVTGDLAQSKSSLDSAIEICADYPNPYFYRAEVNKLIGESTEAEADMNLFHANGGVLSMMLDIEKLKRFI